MRPDSAAMAACLLLLLGGCGSSDYAATMGGLPEDGSSPEIQVQVSGGARPSTVVDSHTGWTSIDVTAGERLQVQATATDPGGVAWLELSCPTSADVDEQLREGDEAGDLNPTEGDTSNPEPTVFAVAGFTVPEDSELGSFEVQADAVDVEGNNALPVVVRFVVHRSEDPAAADD